MIEYLDISKFFDGFLLAAGIAAAWLLAVISASLIRSFGNAGGSGLMFAIKYVTGMHQYRRGDLSNIVNVTLNTFQGGRLSVDTIVGDKLLQEVWSNVYHCAKLKAAAKRCTEDDPVIKFPLNGSGKRSDYRLTYDPLISMIAERCTNDGSIGLALGLPSTEHRFVIALTFEVLNDLRSLHFRCMMIAEDELLSMTNMPLLTVAQAEQAGRMDAKVETTGRIKTIKQIAAQYKTNPEHFGIVKVWRQ